MAIYNISLSALRFSFTIMNDLSIKIYRREISCHLSSKLIINCNNHGKFCSDIYRDRNLEEKFDGRGESHIYFPECRRVNDNRRV